MIQIKRSKSESKYYNTACLMDEALLSLLEKKPFEYITVKEVCKRAGVNRSTFYLHYENMTELLSEALKFVISNLKEKFLEDDFKSSRGSRSLLKGSSEEGFLLFSKKYLIPYLEFVKENKALFLAVELQPSVFEVDETFEKLYQGVFEPILKQLNLPIDEGKYKVIFYINGISAVISQWIKNGFVEEIDQLAKLIDDCIPRLVI